MNFKQIVKNFVSQAITLEAENESLSIDYSLDTEEERVEVKVYLDGELQPTQAFYGLNWGADEPRWCAFTNDDEVYTDSLTELFSHIVK